jgi:hypothetical protein
MLLVVVFAFLLASDLHNRGINQKWGTAIIGTIITFGFVVYACRQMLGRWAFLGRARYLLRSAPNHRLGVLSISSF